MTRRPLRALLAPIAVLAFASATARAAAPAETLSAAEIALQLRKLNVVGTVLYVAAHPDDENGAFLAWGAKGRLLETGYLSVTRGDGGQNLIGNEAGELVGVLRTQELLAARRIDGARQFFTRAIDFGYSKSSEETFAIWGHEQVLSDVVWIVRSFRPDVIVTRFPTTGEGGHGNHTASAILASEAFAAAADPARFPEQLKWVRPWQVKRVFWNVFRFGGDAPRTAVPGQLTLDLGAYNPLLGRSYTEIGGQSRSMHKSQGFGAAERRGTWMNDFKLVAGAPATSDLFEGVDLSWKRYGDRGEEIGKILRKVEEGFRETDPAASVPGLVEAWTAIGRLHRRGCRAARPLHLLRNPNLRLRLRLSLRILSSPQSAPRSPRRFARVSASGRRRSRPTSRPRRAGRSRSRRWRSTARTFPRRSRTSSSRTAPRLSRAAPSLRTSRCAAARP